MDIYKAQILKKLQNTHRHLLETYKTHGEFLSKTNYFYLLANANKKNIVYLSKIKLLIKMKLNFLCSSTLNYHSLFFNYF